MTFLERVLLARADEQMHGLDMHEPVTHDRWRIRCERVERGARLKVGKRPHCLACDGPASHAGYCSLHYQRVIHGIPVDVDSWPTWGDYRRMSRGGRKFGGRIQLRARRGVTAAGGER